MLTNSPGIRNAIEKVEPSLIESLCNQVQKFKLATSGVGCQFSVFHLPFPHCRQTINIE